MKRGLSVLLIIVMLLLTAMPALASTYEESLRVITELGYSEEYPEDKEITRGEAADMLVKLMEIGYIAQPEGALPYEDISPAHPCREGIASALQLGMISYDTEFRPDDKITYAEMVKMIVSLLGYNDVALELGGYPAGYLQMAQRLEILNGISASSGDIVVANDATVMLYNTFRATVREPIKFTAAEGAIFYNGENKLYQYLGYEMIHGIVEANAMTTLNGPTEMEEDIVAIGNKDNLFHVGATDIANYIGYDVYAFYKTLAGQKREIRTFFANPDYKTKTLTYKDSPFAYVENGRIVIEYWTESGRISLIETDAERYIYNGVCTKADATIEELDALFADFKGATMTLIRNDIGSEYDVIKIDRPVSGLVTRVDAENNTLYYKNYAIAGHEVKVQFDKNAKLTVYSPKGELAELASIEPGVVVSIYANGDMTRATIQTSIKTITGTLNRKNSKGEYYIHDGKTEETYEIWNTLPDSLLTLGLHTKFYLNAEGFITGLDTDSVNYSYYGLLMDVSDGRTPYIKVLTSEGELKVLECEDRIYAYNGKEVAKTDFEDLICYTEVALNYSNVPKYMIWYENNAKNFTYDTTSSQSNKRFYWRPGLSQSDMSDAASRKPIYYELNDKGKVKKIIVPDIPLKEENKISSMNVIDDTEHTLWAPRRANLSISSNSANKTLRFSPNAIAYSCLVRTYGEEDYKYAGAYSYFTDGSLRKFQLYSIEDSGRVDLAVGYDFRPYENITNMPLVVIDNVNECLNDVFEIEGYSGGDAYLANVSADIPVIERDLYYKDGSDYTKLKANNILDVVGGASMKDMMLERNKMQSVKDAGLKFGDIIMLGKDRSENIVYIEVVMRAEDGVNLMPSFAGSNNFIARLGTSGQIEKGVITKYDDGQFNVRVVNEHNSNRKYTAFATPTFTGTYYDEVQLVRFSYSKCKIMEVDYATKRIKPASYTSLNEGDVVLYKGRAFDPTNCIILRNNPIEPDYGTYWYVEEESGESGEVAKPRTFALDSMNYTAGYNMVNAYSSSGIAQFTKGTDSGVYVKLPFSNGKLNFSGSADEVQKITLDIEFNTAKGTGAAASFGIYAATEAEMGSEGFGKNTAMSAPSATTPLMTFEVPKLAAGEIKVISLDITSFAKSKLIGHDDLYIYIRKTQESSDANLRIACWSGSGNGAAKSTPMTIKISYVGDSIEDDNTGGDTGGDSGGGTEPTPKPEPEPEPEVPVRPAEFKLSSVNYFSSYKMVNAYTSSGIWQWDKGTDSGGYIKLPFSHKDLAFNGTIDNIDKIYMDITVESVGTTSAHTFGVFAATAEEFAKGTFKEKAGGVAPASTTPLLTFDVPQMDKGVTRLVTLDITELAKNNLVSHNDLYIFIRHNEKATDNKIRMHCFTGTDANYKDTTVPVLLRMTYK